MAGDVDNFSHSSDARRSNVFILSDTRSGSTLLDQCLGAHPDFTSLGEVHWLRAYALEERSLYDPVHPLVCSCGETVSSCPFWTSVRVALGRPLDVLTLGFSGGNRLVRRFPELLHWRAIRQLMGSQKVARDTIALFDAVKAATGIVHCVDSSKSAIRFRAVYEREPARTIAVLLTRDYRAVVRSKMKRGMELDAAAIGWRRKMNQIEVLTSDLPPNAVWRVRYEDLCENPRRELEGLCNFIGVTFDEGMLRRPMQDLHHIGGSPSKFDKSKVEISLDNSYLETFNAEEIARMRNLVGETASRWGY